MKSKIKHSFENIILSLTIFGSWAPSAPIFNSSRLSKSETRQKIKIALWTEYNFCPCSSIVPFCYWNLLIERCRWLTLNCYSGEYAKFSRCEASWNDLELIFDLLHGLFNEKSSLLHHSKKIKFFRSLLPNFKIQFPYSFTIQIDLLNSFLHSM